MNSCTFYVDLSDELTFESDLSGKLTSYGNLSGELTFNGDLSGELTSYGNLSDELTFDGDLSDELADPEGDAPLPRGGRLDGEIL